MGHKNFKIYLAIFFVLNLIRYIILEVLLSQTHKYIHLHGNKHLTFKKNVTERNKGAFTWTI